MSACRPGLAAQYPAYIEPLRAILQRLELPYIIENVEGAPLLNPVRLCGFMFGLPLYRHRLFECSFEVIQPTHPDHSVRATKAGHWEPSTVMSVAGNIAPMAVARDSMGIHWTNRPELTEAIPPVYSEYIGQSLAEHLESEAAA